MPKPAIAPNGGKVSRPDKREEGPHVYTASDGRKFVRSNELIRDPLIQAQIKLAKKQNPDLYKK